MRMSQQQPEKPGNDNPLTAKVKSAVPTENWLDFRKRELVLAWSDGTESRYELSDPAFKKFLEEGIQLRNL